MGNDLQIGSHPSGPAAHSLPSVARVGPGSAQLLSDPSDLLGLADQSAAPGIEPRGEVPLLLPAAQPGVDDGMDADDDAGIDAGIDLGSEHRPGLLPDDDPGEGGAAPHAAASGTGPYRESDYLEFRRRHYESARQFVTSLRNKPLLGVAADQALVQIEADVAHALAAFEAGSGQVAGRRGLPASFSDMATLVGGRGSPTKWGWVRCLFSSNARRARTIQQQAERGQSFQTIYRGNKVANIHPKAALALFIRGRLKAEGLGDHDWAATAEISKRLGQEYLKLTEKSEAWRIHTFRHRFAAIDGKPSLEMTSRLTPASQLPALASGYSDQQRGVSSMNSREDQHPANLWMTEFTPAGQSAARLSFRGFRHGVLDAYGIKNESKRKEANQNKVTELVRAAGSEMASACVRQPDGSWLITMVSVSLQTYGKETDMIEAQKKAWAAVAEQGVEMAGPAPDGSAGPWTLKPDPVTFSVGVNFAAMHAGGHWKTAQPENDRAIATLLQAAGAFRDRLSFSNSEEALRKKAIAELIGQIEAMREDRSYQSIGQNPYKFAARVLLLAQLAGLVPCFNCKSGKDRTGVVDIEVKSLLQSINENIQRHGAAALSAAAVANAPDAPSIVPSYASGRTASQKVVFKDLHLNGGSQQVSLATTGLMGNKTRLGNYLEKNLDRDRLTLKLIVGFARNADGNKA